MVKGGILTVISGPAGSGKSTLAESLIRKNPGSFRRAVTSTTRPPRPGEIDGLDYQFLSRDSFENRLAAGDFIEHNVFNGNYYGTPRQTLREDLAKGGVVILVIDVNGARAIRKFFPDAVSVFVIPPTPRELRHRLRGRGTEDLTNVERRLAIAEEEITHVDEYRHLIVNDSLRHAVRDLEAIARAAASASLVAGAAENWRRGDFADWKNQDPW